jgi:hypothetical protein
MARPRKDTEGAPELKRIQMDMAPLTLARLQKMQRRTESASYAETIRNALLLYEQMLDATKDGGTLIVRDGGSDARILFAFEDVERTIRIQAKDEGGTS